jgi:hypothetical protein
MQVPDSPGLIVELLLTHPSYPSISTQTEAEDLSAKLEAVDTDMRRKRQIDRRVASEDLLKHGIEQIERDFEARFSRELANRMNIWRNSDLLRMQSDDTTRHSAELDRIRREMEADLKRRTSELRTQFQRDSDVVRVKQRELEREIGKWAERTVKKVATDSDIAEIERIKRDTENKAQKIRAKSMVLAKKVEKERRRLEDMRLEHNRAKREIEKLRMAINLYETTHEN